MTKYVIWGGAIPISVGDSYAELQLNLSIVYIPSLALPKQELLAPTAGTLLREAGVMPG